MRRTAPARRRISTVLAVVACLLTAMVANPAPSGAAGPTVSPTSLAFSTLQVGKSLTKIVTLTRSEETVLSVPDITVSTGSSSDYELGNIPASCYSLAGGKCMIPVAFTPQEVGASKATMHLQVCNTTQTQCTALTVTMTGTGTLPGKLSPASIAFGAVPKGLTTAKTVTVTVNAGYAVVGIGTSGDQSFAVANIEPNCSSSGPSTCTFQATFTPYQAPGVKGAVNVTFCHPDGRGPCVVAPIPLSGTGTAAATVTPNSVAFGQVVVGTPKSAAIAVKVLGGWYVALIYTTSGPFDYANEGDGCGPTGPVTCNFNLVYSPTDTVASTGTASVLVCSLSGQYCEVDQITMSGTGKPPGAVSPTPVAIGNAKVGLSAGKPVTVTYDAGWEVHSVRFDSHQSVLSTDANSACNPDNPGTKCIFTASFAPTALGPITANMIVTMCTIDGRLCSDLKPVPVTATGTAPATQSATSLAFGNEPVNQTATKTFTVTPDAGWYVHQVTPGTPAVPFTAQLASNCDNGPGLLCTVNVTFAPTVAHAEASKVSVDLCNITTALCFTMTPVSLTGTGIQTATKTTLAVQSIRPNLGFADHLTASVSPLVDGGTVSFYAGGQVICTVAVTSSSTAACVWSPTHTGSYQLKATYSGDAAFKASTSSTTTATAIAPPP